MKMGLLAFWTSVCLLICCLCRGRLVGFIGLVVYRYFTSRQFEDLCLGPRIQTTPLLLSSCTRRGKCKLQNGLGNFAIARKRLSFSFSFLLRIFECFKVSYTMPRHRSLATPATVEFL